MTRTILEIAAAVVLGTIAVGCEKSERGTEKRALSTSGGSTPVAGQPDEFFPTGVGLKWTYAIRIGDAEPLRYQEISWPLGDARVVYANRGRFLPLAQEKSKKQFCLVIRSKATASKQGPLEYPTGIELEVLQDDLGVFEDVKQIFWAIRSGDRFMAHLVTTYDAMSTPSAPTGGPWGSWGQGDGYSIRLVLFGDRPGIAIGMGKSPNDILLFEGVDTSAEGHAGQELLRFTRSVEGSKDEESGGELGRAFSEQVWFARGRGLVRLVQTVGGETSMVWTLSALSEE